MSTILYLCWLAWVIICFCINRCHSFFTFIHIQESKSSTKQFFAMHCLFIYWWEISHLFYASVITYHPKLMLCFGYINVFFYLFISFRKIPTFVQKSRNQPQHSQPCTSHALCRRRITGGSYGGLINDATLKSLDFRRDYLFPFSLLLHNTRPVGRQVLTPAL